MAIQLFSGATSYFQTYGIMDFLLPFLLVFTIVFAVLQRTEILGKHKKNFNVVIALILAIMFIVPHMTGNYPSGYDPVQVLNEALPSVSLVAVAAIMLLLLMGIFGGDFAKGAIPFIAIIAIAFVVYIFGSTSALDLWSGPSVVFSWWTSELTELLIIILIFGLIVFFITREPLGEANSGSRLMRGLDHLFRRGN